MTTTYRVRHETRYGYGELIPHGQNEARVLPRPLGWQYVRQEQVEIQPEPNGRRERTDYFGNRVLYFSTQRPHDELVVVSSFDATLDPSVRPDPAESATEWAALVDWLAPGLHLDAMEIRPWAYESPRIPLDPEIGAYAREAFAAAPRLFDACAGFMDRLHQDFAFDPVSTSVTTSVTEAFAQRSGVCQDFAHIMICGLRSIGLAARYVSGYLETFPPPGQEKLAGADATHAWVSVYDPAVGWVDFDPTNNLIPRDQHITIGWGRDFSDIIPVRGVVIGGEHHELNVFVDVHRIDPVQSLDDADR